MVLNITSDYREENQLTSDLEVEIVLAVCLALKYFFITLLIAYIFL